MTPITTTAGLIAALKGAVAGTVLILAPGTYSGVGIVNINPAGTVTIAAAPGAAASAPKIVGLSIYNSSNLAFSGLELTSVGASDPLYAFRVAGSKNITFSGIDLHGDPAKEPGAQVSGLYVSSTDGFSLTNSRLHDINAPVTVNRSQHITLANNDCSRVSKGCFELGGDSFVAITDNDTHDFIVSPGIHSDAIQIYTQGTTAAAHDIAITGNLFWRGTGDAAQGIFISDEVGSLPYGALTITGNGMLGGLWNSVYVNHASGPVRLSGNISASWPGADAQKGTARPYPTTSFQANTVMRLTAPSAISEAGDQAQGYLGSAGQNIPTPAGNVKLSPITDQGRALICAWAKAHPGRRNFCN